MFCICQSLFRFFVFDRFLFAFLYILERFLGTVCGIGFHMLGTLVKEARLLLLALLVISLFFFS